MKKIFPILVALVAAWFYTNEPNRNVEPAPTTAPATTTAPVPFVSGSQLTGVGTVVRVLPDDNDGSRHQRFILRLPSGRTVLVAHNIDLAPRVVGIKGGDTIEFNGEFESNRQGGVIHWTHHDPQARHIAGWLKHNGRTYQ